MSYYHGTDDLNFDITAINPSSRCYDVCLTWDEDVAKTYALRWCSDEAVILDIDADGLIIAETEEALEILGFDEWDIREMLCDTSALFHTFDCQTNRAKLVAAGFNAVEYDDCLPGTTRTFVTTRVFVPGLLKVASMESCI